MADKQLQRLYLLLLDAHNLDDIINLIQKLADDAADVRTHIPDIGEADSIIVRKAINSYLINSIDTFRRMRKNISTSDVADD